MRTAKFYRVTFVTVLLLLAFVLTAGILSDGGRLVPVGDVTSSVAPEEVTATSDDVASAVTAALVSNTGYIHGSRIEGRITSGTKVTTPSQFLDAIDQGQDVDLQNNITLDAGDAFSKTNAYGGTIYGNGHTIEYSGQHIGNSYTGDQNHGSSRGGLIAELTGAIYDLNVVFTGGQIAYATSSGSGDINVGGIVGKLSGGTIENCSMSFTNATRLCAAAWSSTYKESIFSSRDTWPVAGGVVARVTAGSTIRNVTVRSSSTNMWIESGLASINGSALYVNEGSTSRGAAGMLAGYLESGDITIENIVVEGQVSLKSRYISALGMSEGVSTSVTTKNFYNNVQIDKFCDTNGNGIAYVKHDGNGKVSVVNMYRTANAFDENGTLAGGITNKVTVMTDANTSLFFDPSVSDEDNSLVVVKSGIAGGDTKKATLTTYSGSTYEDYAFDDDGNTVIFRNLPTAASYWNQNGEFYYSIYLSDRYVSNPVIGDSYEYTGTAIDAAISMTFNDSPYTDYTLSYSASGNGAQLSDGKPLTAGIYTINITLGGGNTFSNGTSQYQLALTIDKKTIQNPSMTLVDAVYNGQEKTPVFEASNANADAVTVSYGGDRVNVGTFVATVTPNENHRFSDVESKEYQFSIEQKDVTVTASNAEKQFGEENPAFGYRVTDGKFYEEIEVSFTCDATATSNAGEPFYIELSVSVVGGDNGNYNITYEKGTLTVVPRQVTIGLSDDPAASVIEYPGLGVVPNAELLKLFLAPKDIDEQPLFLNFSVTKGGEEATALYAGEYTVTASLPESYMNDEGKTVSQANYIAAPAVAALTVKAKEITVVASGAETSKTYDGNVVGEDVLLGLFFTNDIYEEGGEVVLVVTVYEGEVKNVGSYTVTVSLEEGAEKMYAISDTSVKSLTYTVTPKAISVNWSESAFVYNGKEQKPEASAVDVIVGDTVNVSVTVKEGEAINAGSYTAVAASDNANYTFTSAEKVFEIARASLDGLSVTIDGWTHGDEAATPEVVGNVENGDVTYRYKSTDGKGYSAAVAPTAAGDYKLTVTVAATANYEAGSANCAFTVAKKSIAKPTAYDVPFVYTGAEQTYVPVGFDESTMTVEGNKRTDVQEGGYVVTVALADAANFEWADGTSEALTFGFVIGKASLTDSTVDAVADYDGAAHGISVVLDGFVGGENIESAGGKVEYSVNGTDGWSADNIAVTDATEGEVTVFYRVTFANYATVEGSATVTVNPKSITIKGITAVEREYDGTTTVPLTGGNLVGVIVNDEVTFEAGTGTLESADAGEGKTVSTAIVLTGADAGNYVLAQPAVTVNIVRKTVTIDVVEAGVAREYDKDTVTTDYAALFTAPNDVGEDGELALVFGVVAEGLPVEDGIKVVGVYTVTANLADADGNYTAAEATVTYTVTVKKITEPSFTAPELIYNGTPQGVTIAEDDYYTVGGSTSATDAGDYVATVSLVDKVNTSWTDGGTDELEFPWSIAKATPKVYVVVTLPGGGLFASDEELPPIAVDAERTSVAGSVAWNEGQSLVAGTKEYGWTFTPEDATNYNVVVGGEELTVNAVEIVGIAVTAEPYKKVYEYGDEFDKTGMEVTVNYNNGATKAVVDFEVSVVTFDTLGEVSVTVTYEGKTASVTVTVNVRKIDKPVPSIPSFTYNGDVQGITIDENVYYTVGGMTSATDAGDYVAIVSLVDKVNTSWADGSTDNLEFSWSIAKATPTVTPAVVFDGTLYTSDDLPAIATTDGDTAGTIAWAEGQPLVAGTHRYNWIFVPTDSDNYTEITGTYELSAVAVAVESIEVTRNPDKVVYEYGDGFDNAGMVVTASYNNGEQSAIDGYSVMPETFDVIGDSISVTVTYEGKTCSVTVQVVKKVVTIDGVAAVTREYDGTAEVTLKGGTLVGIVGDDKVTFELGKGLLEDPNAGDNKAVTTSITLGGADADKYTLAQPTDVKAVIKQAKSTVNPVVSCEGVIYTSSAFPSIMLSEGDTEGTIKWDDGQSLVAGEHEYFWTFIPADAVNYETVNDTYVLTVEAVVLESIEVTFDAGDDLIYASTSVDSLRQYLTVTGVNNDGTPYEGTIEYTLSGIIKAGDCVITVTVVGTQISDTFTVAVVGTSVTGIEISAQPAKTQYTAFEDFDKTGMVVVAVYADGNRKPVTDYEIEGGTDLRVGTDKVTVVFNGFSQEVSITVSPVKVAKPAPAINPFVYNGTEQGIEISQSEYYSVSGTTSATDAGDYSATATLCDGDNTEWADGSTDALVFEWSIAKADYDMSGITLGDDTVEYDGKEHNLRIDGTLPTGLDGITLSVEYSAGIKDADSVTVTATFVTASVNYNVPAPLTATLTVTAKTLQVVWLNYVGLVYNGKAQAPMATVKTGVQGETVRLIVEGAQTEAGENYVATAVMETPSDNYILTNTTVEFSIGKATPDYSVPDDLEIAQGQDLEDVVLPDGWTWKEGSLRVNNKGETVATAIYTPADASNYETVEVEVVLASASSSPSEPDVAPETEPEGLGTGAIIGIVIGALLLLVIIIVVIAVARKKKKS